MYKVQKSNSYVQGLILHPHIQVQSNPTVMYKLRLKHLTMLNKCSVTQVLASAIVFLCISPHIGFYTFIRIFNIYYHLQGTNLKRFMCILCSK